MKLPSELFYDTRFHVDNIEEMADKKRDLTTMYENHDESGKKNVDTNNLPT